MTIKGIEMQRYPDIYVERTQTAIEVKHGVARGGGRASKQLKTDLALLDDDDDLMEAVEWHFFARGNGTIGPDADLLKKLQNAQATGLVTFTIWVP